MKVWSLLAELPAYKKKEVIYIVRKGLNLGQRSIYDRIRGDNGTNDAETLFVYQQIVRVAPELRCEELENLKRKYENGEHYETYDLD